MNMPDHQYSRRRLLTMAGAGLPALGLAAWGLDAVAAPRARAAEGDLVWSQEFNDAAGTAPDSAVWNYDLGAGGWGNNELQTYTDSRDNSAMDGNGNLAITAKQDGSGYTSARLQTNDKFEVTNGRIEANIKIPRGQGLWPAFWMLGGSFPGTAWPDCGEIDIMENVGKEPATVHGTVHGPGYSGANGITASYQHPQGWSFADTWHLFTLDKRPGQLTWSVDGVSYFTVDRSSVGSNAWVFDEPFFIILNVAVGGDWPGAPDSSTQFPQQMLVDYVRVYDNGS